MELPAARITRPAEAGDLEALQRLYLHANPDTPTLPPQRAAAIWHELQSGHGAQVFVSVVEGAPVSACTLITAPNLMRGGAPHAFIENVVTEERFRRLGHGRATIGAALEAAWGMGCYQVALFTGRGRLNPWVLAFYERCGLVDMGKAALIARRPATWVAGAGEALP